MTALRLVDWLHARAVELHREGPIDAQIKSATNAANALTEMQIEPLADL